MATINYYHGSSSASFVGTLSEESPGLRPLSLISEKGIIPYSGEFGIGFLLKGGISRVATSAVDIFHINEALRYALISTKQNWTPLKSGRKIISIEERLNSMPRSKYLLGEDGEFCRSILLNSKLLEKIRLRHWSDLSESKRDLVSNPFPVLYGIRYGGEVYTVHSDSPGEVGIPGKVGLEDITLYVPSKRFNDTLNLAKGLDVVPKVAPIGVLAFLRSYVDSRNLDSFKSLVKKIEDEDLS